MVPIPGTATQGTAAFTVSCDGDEATGEFTIDDDALPTTGGSVTRSLVAVVALLLLGAGLGQPAVRASGCCSRCAVLKDRGRVGRQACWRARVGGGVAGPRGGGAVRQLVGSDADEAS